jgi:apolipoprotein N-acyltransferase
VKTSLLFIASLLSGAIYSLGFPNAWGEGFWPLALIGFGAQFHLLHFYTKSRQQLFSVWFFNLAFHLMSFYWVGGTLQEFGELPPPWNHLLGSLLFLIHNPTWYAYIFWLKFSPRLKAFQHFSLELQSLWIAMFFTFFEILLPQQFPVFMAHILTPYSSELSFTPWIGMSVYSFFLYWLVLCSRQVILSRGKNARIGLSFVLIFALLHFIFPSLEGESSGPTKSLKMRLVQANIGNFFKVASETGDEAALEIVLGRYEKLSLQNIDANTFDLIIWPETAYPFPLPSDRLLSGERQIPQLFRQVISLSGAEFIVGGYDQKSQSHYLDSFETDYNAVYHFSTNGSLKSVYRKHRLIPFGETLPFGPLNKWLSTKLDNVSFFARGSDFPLFRTHNDITFVTPICYEILDSFFIKRMLNTAGPVDFILNLTNDSWYGDTAEPRQHLALAKWRSMEFSMPLVRSTNTGITSIIYPNGKESRRLNVESMGVLDMQLSLPQTPPVTLYRKLGYFPLMGLWFFLLSFILIWDRWKIQRSSNLEA